MGSKLDQPIRQQQTALPTQYGSDRKLVPTLSRGMGLSNVLAKAKPKAPSYKSELL